MTRSILLFVFSFALLSCSKDDTPAPPQSELRIEIDGQTVVFTDVYVLIRERGGLPAYREISASKLSGGTVSQAFTFLFSGTPATADIPDSITYEAASYWENGFEDNWASFFGDSLELSFTNSTKGKVSGSFGSFNLLNLDDSTTKVLSGGSFSNLDIRRISLD